MTELPRLYVKFRDEHPEIAEAFDTLGWLRMHSAWTWARDIFEGR